MGILLLAGVSHDLAKDGAASFSKVLAFIGTFVTVTVTIRALAGSKSLSLITALFVHEDNEQVPVQVRITVAAFHLITNGFHMFAFWLQCTSVVYFSYGMTNILNQMNPRMSSNDVFQSKNKRDRIGKQFARDYRSLSIMQAHFAGLFRHYISILQTAAIFCVVTNTYQAVVRENFRSLLLALAVFFGEIQFIHATAQVHHTSTSVLHRWRQMQRRDVPHWFPKFLKSCRKVSVPVGSFFYIDRGLLLTVLSIVTNASASLIVTK